MLFVQSDRAQIYGEYFAGFDERNGAEVTRELLPRAAERGSNRPSPSS